MHLVPLRSGSRVRVQSSDTNVVKYTDVLRVGPPRRPKPYIKRTFRLKHLRDHIEFREDATRELTLDDLFLEMVVGCRPDEVCKTSTGRIMKMSCAERQVEFAMDSGEHVLHYILEDY